jgi:hypothetical protein
MINPITPGQGQESAGPDRAEQMRSKEMPRITIQGVKIAIHPPRGFASAVVPLTGARPAGDRRSEIGATAHSAEPLSETA